MDQIKTILLWLIRNRFWVVCVLVAAASLVTWFLAWSEIDKQRAEQQQKIASKHSAIKSVLDTTVPTDDPDAPVPVHPNDITQAQMDVQIQAAAESAMAAWQVRYDQQKDVLKFAEEIPAHIRTVLEKHQPMELPLEQELMEKTFRDTYREFIVARMPGLARETLDATWQYDEKGKPIAQEKKKLRDLVSGQATSGAQQEDLVIWNSANQELWHSKVTEFAGFDGNSSPENIPTSEQMLVLQQDLWILEAMFKIVAKVNEGYVANDLAPIKRLDHVLVGADALAAERAAISPVTFRTDLKAGDALGKTSGRSERRLFRSAASAAPSRGAVAFNNSESRSPFHGRYVDRDYRQLGLSEIVNALTAKQMTDRSYLAVAKRIPVRVGVRMDERKINDFIAAAANSPFTFEIRQVRINRHVPNAGVKRESGRGGNQKGDLTVGGGGGGGGGSTLSDTGGAGSGGGGDSGDGPFIPEQRKTFDVNVEFSGIVKIYNPPNRAVFFPNADEDAPPAMAPGGKAAGNTTASK